MSPPRIWLSNREPEKDEVVTVRVMVAHRMETGLRRDAEGLAIPRNIIHSFDCRLDDEPIFSWHLDTSVSQNPYLEFRFRALRAGNLHMVWEDEAGERIEAREEIVLV